MLVPASLGGVGRRGAPLSANDRRTKPLRNKVEVVAASLNLPAKVGNRDVGYSTKIRVLAQPSPKGRARNVEHLLGAGVCGRCRDDDGVVSGQPPQPDLSNSGSC